VNSNVAIVSAPTLETWDWRNPWTKGIGGSETSHIECAVRLRRRGFAIESWSPLGGIDFHDTEPPIPWYDSMGGGFRARDYKVLINYRSPELFDTRKPKGAKWWLVAQDTDYPTLTPERIEKIDRYICLCKKHAQYTQEKYPALRGKTYISSNGVRSELIRELVAGREVRNPVTGVAIKPQERNPKRMFYASSPDRGIKLILENWFRIKERVPDAEIVVAYGLDNMEVIIRKMAGRDWRAEYARELESLFQQEGVQFTGRIDQGRVYEEWLQAGVCPIFTDFPETNMICCQEAQALGAWPVSNDLWAPGEFVQYGRKFQGVPQKSQVLLHTMLSALCDEMVADQNTWERKDWRCEMQEWALKQFDWERTVSQWSGWLEEDLKK